RQVLAAEAAKLDGAADPWALFLRADQWPLVLTLSGAKVDAEGHAWDLTIRGTWTITDPRALLRAGILERTGPETPLSESDLLGWVLGRIEPQMREEIDRQSLA